MYLQYPSANKDNVKSHRTLFISDLHLGARGCQPEAIIEFLRGCRVDTIYLVGDIFDFWHVGKIYWSKVHDDIIAELNRLCNSGIRMVYLVGNHDRKAREVAYKYFHKVEIEETVLHRSANGKKYLIAHGDQADGRILRLHFMTLCGSRLDALLRSLDKWLNSNRKLSSNKKGFFKSIIFYFNKALFMGDRFEKLLTKMAKDVGADGVICGHSHRPGIWKHNDLIYANCGDWVDSLTAVTEDHSGHIELFEWKPEPKPRSRLLPFSEAQLGNKPEVRT